MNEESTVNKVHHQHKVPGLRDMTWGGEVRVYRANPDGSKGEFLRIEKPYIVPDDAKLFNNPHERF